MSLRKGWGREKHGKLLGWVRLEPAAGEAGEKFCLAARRDREKWAVAHSKEMVLPEHSMPVGMHLSKLLHGMVAGINSRQEQEP